jgi:hypothetical protein
MNNSMNHHTDEDDMVNYNGGDPEELLSYLVDGSLDHALLESLFYNEMALLSSGNHTYGDESLFASTPSPGSADSHLPPPVPSSVNGGFSFLDGGTDRMTHASPMESPSPLYEGTTPGATIAAGSVMQSTPLMTYQPVSTQDHPSLPTFHTASFPSTDASNNIALSAPPAVQNPLYHAVTPAYAPPLPHALPNAVGGTQYPPGLPVPVSRLVARGGIRHNVVAVLDQDGRTQQPIKTATAKSAPSHTEEEKRKKLVAQFATLAGRLGITLPPQVLEKLTNKASSNTATTDVTVALDPTVLSVTPPAVATSGMEVAVDTTPPPELLQQLQTTAAEAIAAVHHKRAAVAPTLETTASDKPYSKRRKKPRLSECEQKLQELQSENAILKRHLDNIANRNARLDQERIKAETQMRQLLEENAPDAVLDPIVKNFTEMYSDYGRKRHDELNFHLQQLKRLANPTNFTKMGLWTLGGGGGHTSSPSPAEGDGTKRGSPNGSHGKAGNGSGNKNPIAGMLQRELGISAPQGRKILEQRQKIQNVCSNLKEVCRY